MLKADAQRRTSGSATRERILEAALQTLRDEGFAGASARAIARKGGFNQALIFYHFGSLGGLFLEALDQTSGARMERYRSATSGVPAGELVRVARELYQEDLDEGHIIVLTELIAGSASDDELRRAIAARMEPWLEFATEKIKGVLASLGIEGFVAPRTAATALLALYLGIDMLVHLDGDASRAERLFEAAGAVTAVLPALGVMGDGA